MIESLRNENEQLRRELMRLGEEIQSYDRIERLLRSADGEEPDRRRGVRGQRDKRQRGMSGRPNLPADRQACSLPLRSTSDARCSS